MATKGGNNTGRHKQTERGGAALKNKCTKNKTRKNHNTKKWHKNKK